MTISNDATRAGAWLPPARIPAQSDDASIRLFCLPHAGAGTAMYNLWKRLLPATIEVCPIQIPGRETRLSEDSITDSASLIEQITSVIAPHLDKPYAIFGHSMGALLTLDLAQNIVGTGLPAPSYLFVSGRNATHIPIGHSMIHKLPDDEFLSALATRYGGLPQEILNTPELLEVYLPILRADLTLLETHRYDRRPPLACPIAALAGKDDRNVSAQGLEAWSEHTTSHFETRLFDGDHFYLSGPSRPLLLALLIDRLAPIIADSNAK